MESKYDMALMFLRQRIVEMVLEINSEDDLGCIKITTEAFFRKSKNKNK